MINYIDVKTGYNLIKFNKDTDEIKVLDSFTANIDYIWIADEDGMLDDVPVNIGDIIIRMYGNTGKWEDKQTLVIKDEKLKNYYKDLKEQMEKRKAEQEKCCECCDSICCEKPCCKG